MKKFIIVSLILFVVVLGVSNAQTIVEPGDGTLSAAVLAAGDGDVLILKDGGEYIESTSALLPMKVDNKTLTIKAEDGYAKRPLLTFPAVQSGTGLERPNAFALLNGGIILQGLEVDGGMADTTQFSPLQEVVSYVPELSNSVKVIKISDCFIHDLMWPLGYVVGGGGAYDGLFIGADTCIINNNLFFKAPKTISFQYTLCTYLEVTNNTFWHGTRQIIRVEDKSNGNDPIMLIDHNTFYSNANKALQLRLGNAENSGITVTNNIFAKMEKTYGDNFLGNLREAVEIRTATNTTITNNCTFLTSGYSVVDTTDLKDNIDVDPKFATDPGNYPEADADFTLAEDSPLVGKATDGTAIGDPRWDPGTTAVEPKEMPQMPNDFVLHQNYPNPFNPATTISFYLDSSDRATLTVHNTLGQEVAMLVNKNLPAGEYTVSFNGSDLPSGIYLYRLKSGDFRLERKMLLLK